mgnify:CR=1 FL=1
MLAVISTQELLQLFDARVGPLNERAWEGLRDNSRKENLAYR